MLEYAQTAWRVIVSASIVVLGLSVPELASGNPASYGILGQKAPALQVDEWTGADGKKLDAPRLVDHRGKLIYLYCFQSWCPGCHSSGFPALAKLSDTFKDNENIVFLAVQTVFEGHAVNTAAKIPEIRKKYGLQIPIGHDPGTKASGNVSTVMRSYRTGGTPWTILIDPEGTVIFNHFHIDTDRAIHDIRQLLEKAGTGS